MAIPLDDSILIGQQKATDAKYDNDGQPLGYTSIAQAKSIITIGLRYAGLTIKINGIEYWWPSDETDLTIDPIIKTLPTTIFPDGLISGGNIDISDFSNGNITVAPAQWLLTISGTQSVYQSTTPTLFSGIGLSSSGNQRYVAFFGDANGDIIKVEGAQSPAAVMPSTPANTVPIGHVLITDAVAQPPVVDLSQYALKSEIIYAMLMGLVFANTAIANGDSIVTAFGKIQGQLNAKQNSSDKATVSDINTGTDDAKFLTSLGLQGSKYIDRTFSKISATTSGTSTAYTASLSPALTAYSTNQIVLLTFNVASGASPSININSLGARNLLRMDGTAIQANDLLTTPKYLFVYDGTAFRLLTLIANDNIRNQNAAQQAANFWALIGRLDTGLGLGLASNAASFLSLAAATSSKAQMLMTQGGADYTGTINGMFWNNTGEIKFLDSSIVNRVLKIYNNELLKSDGTYAVSANQAGDIFIANKEIEAYVYNTTTITALENGTGWTDNQKTLTAGLIFQGQFYKSDTTKYFYECITDNVVIRIPVRTNISCTKTIIASSSGSSFQDNDLIGANEVQYVITSGAIMQNDPSVYTFNSATGTVTFSSITITTGDYITFTYS